MKVQIVERTLGYPCGTPTILKPTEMVGLMEWRTIVRLTDFIVIVFETAFKKPYHENILEFCKQIEFELMNSKKMRHLVMTNGKHLEHLRKVHVSTWAYDEMCKLIGSEKPEKGGILGYDVERQLITCFHHDANAKKNVVSYSPNVEACKAVIETWKQSGVLFCGFVHSHPCSENLSNTDIKYARKILTARDMTFIHMPVLTKDKENRCSITWWVVTKETVEPAVLIVTDSVPMQ